MDFWTTHGCHCEMVSIHSTVWTMGLDAAGNTNPGIILGPILESACQSLQAAFVRRREALGTPRRSQRSPRKHCKIRRATSTSTSAGDMAWRQGRCSSVHRTRCGGTGDVQVRGGFLSDQVRGATTCVMAVLSRCGWFWILCGESMEVVEREERGLMGVHAPSVFYGVEHG